MISETKYDQDFYLYLSPFSDNLWRIIGVFIFSTGLILFIMTKVIEKPIGKINMKELYELSFILINS